MRTNLSLDRPSSNKSNASWFRSKEIIAVKTVVKYIASLIVSDLFQGVGQLTGNSMIPSHQISRKRKGLDLRPHSISTRNLNRKPFHQNANAMINQVLPSCNKALIASPSSFPTHFIKSCISASVSAGALLARVTLLGPPPVCSWVARLESR